MKATIITVTHEPMEIAESREVLIFLLVQIDVSATLTVEHRGFHMVMTMAMAGSSSADIAESRG